ncbi:MAG: ABC transporter substrate-binding protein [Acidobacteriota bacterium]
MASGTLGRRATRALVAAGVVVMAAAGFGCSRGPRGAIRIAEGSAPSTFDPHHHNEVVVWSVLCNVCDGLVRFSPRMQVEPSLATSWEQLDASHVRFHLRPGVTFHDGSRLTAADVVASFERARRDPRSGIRHYLVGIERMVAEGELAVTVETHGPAPVLLNRLAFLFVVPQGQSREAEITDPIGTGPYRWAGRRSDRSITLEAAGNWRGTPAIHRAVFSFDGDEAIRTESLMAGKLELCDLVDERRIGEIERRPDLRLVPQPRLAVQMLVVVPEAGQGPARGALGDPRVRRALLLAINRDGLINRFYRGRATVASQYVHPAVFGYDPDLREPPHDPAEARRLLREAGYASGFDVTLGHGQVGPGPLEAIVEDLAAVGVRAVLLPLPLGELLRQARLGRIPLVYFARSCTTADASEFLDSAVHTRDAASGLGNENYSRFSDPDVDQLLDAANHELDPGRRLVHLQQAQRRVLAALPILPLTVRWTYLGAAAGLEVEPRDDQWLWVAAFRWRK